MPAAESGSRPSRAGVEDENTPLLAEAVQEVSSTPEPGASTAPIDRQHDDKPLPVGQILLLCYARMVEPIAFFSIFPFINHMVQRNGGIPDEDVGFYSGLIESLFSLTQMFVMVFWGRVADRIGRKPVLVASMIGVTFATGIFGFASTIPQMIVFRCLAGAFGGTIVTIRTMINEHSTAKTQARAFSWFSFSNNLGLFIGPFLGGALADPAKQYGGFFQDIQFFHDFPFALPTIATGIFAAIATVFAVLFIQETMPVANSASGEAPMSTLQLLKAPGVAMVLWLYGHVMLLAFSYTAVSPVFWFTPVPLGGFGFSELLISVFMCLTGISQAIWMLLVFPPLQHRFGTGGVLRGCAIAYPFFFLVCPALNLLLRQDTDTARQMFWIFGTTALCVGVGISMSFTAIQLALNDVSPSPLTLGTLNALALAFVSGIRAFSPVLFNSLFAVGVREQILTGYLVWVIMIAIAAAFAVVVHWLPKNAEGKLRPDAD